MARPKSDPMDLRSLQVNVRLNPHEVAELRARAERSGTTITAFVRASALGKPMRPAPSGSADFATRQELRRVGVNLNQIAKALNSGKGVSPVVLETVCRKLDTLFDQMLAHGSESR